MATVTGLTAARMLAIEAASIVDGAVDLSGHLQLETHGGSFIDAGSVIGPTGPTGPGLSASVIAETTNLNTIVAAGAYIQLVDAWATLVRNYPMAAAGGWLTVTASAGGAILQAYTIEDATNDPAVYLRESGDTGATWTGWRSIVVSDDTGAYRFTRPGYDTNVRITHSGSIDSYDLRNEITPASPARSLWLNYNSGGHVQIGKPGVTTKNVYLNMPTRAERAITITTDTISEGFNLGNGAVFRSGGTAGGCMIQRAGDTGNYFFVTDDGAREARIPAAYSRTTASAANMVVTSNGTLQRSTSLREGKVNIEDAPEDWAEKILELRPRIWTDKYNLERYSRAIDREIAGEEIDWSDVDIQQIDERIPGFVAEEVLDAGLGIFTTRDVDGELNGLAYDRITAGLVSVVQKQQEQIEELKALVSALMEG